MPAKATLPFQGMIDILNNMNPEYRNKLVDNYKKFSNLRSLCEAKGYIEVLPQLKGIRVLKKTSEVIELKGVVDFLKPGKFQWLDETK